MSSVSVDVVYGAMSNALRTSFRVRGLPMAYGYKASCLCESGGEIYISTGLHSPQMGFAMTRGSTNSASLKFATRSTLQWIRGSASYAIFKAMFVDSGHTWISISYIAINWMAFEL